MCLAEFAIFYIGKGSDFWHLGGMTKFWSGVVNAHIRLWRRRVKLPTSFKIDKLLRPK